MSGRNSWRETPVSLSTSNTRATGTRFHCVTACGVILPIARASPLAPPFFAFAISSASFMARMKAQLSDECKRIFR